MKSKDQKEFDALATTEDRAKWLLRKGVTAKPTMFPKLNKLCYGAYSAGVLIPGEYESKEAAISGGTAWLTEKAGLANLKDQQPEAHDPMGRGFMRRIVKRELYAKGEGTMSTMECGHINSGPTSCADDYEKPCLTCEDIARQNTAAVKQ